VSEIAVGMTSVSKRFGSAIALDDFSIEVAEGEFHTILGPSGCGKTTALRVIAGFERPESPVHR
jgi:ABC-type Fe3+/spermidine/putrescine transport system ATPase subunit